MEVENFKQNHQNKSYYMTKVKVSKQKNFKNYK